jgi:hypothetical protein
MLPGQKFKADGSPATVDDLPCRPPLPELNPHNPYFPFKDRVAFEGAMFLYKQAHMPQAQVDVLMQLWAASLFEHGGDAPFDSSHDLLKTIDAIAADTVPWETHTFSFDGDNDGDLASFKKDTYIGYFRDPHELLLRALANPEFDGQFEDAAYQEFDAEDKRVFCEYMSANHAWKRSVR